DLANAQLDLDEEVVGPPETAAFKDGKPTRAAEAFATKLGIAVDQLQIVDRPAAAKQKPGRYVIGRRVEKGRPARELLGKSLVDENASLVEEPHVITGSFEPVFLALPAAVIRAVARGHQKYFCVQKSEDELLPHYIAVANTANDPARIAKGNDRVMRARLAD